MQVMDAETKFAHLGKPGSAFSAGFARRLELMKGLVDFKDKKILDAGCGEGVWLGEFARFTAPENVFGSEYDAELAIEIKRPDSEVMSQFKIPAGNIVVCPGEALAFPDNTFDIVFSNEVLEHVQDDRKCAEEAIRVLKPGGKFVVFTPNRGWPFETHGIFLNGKYVWGNIPFLPWMPKSIFKKFAPHVRNYSNKEVRSLFKDLPATIVYHRHVFPGFDGMVRRFGPIGKLAQRFFHLLEKTPLHFFGISHFIIVQKAS